MKLSVLSENSVGRQNNKLCRAEWGLSLHLDTGGVKILFDTGHSDLFAQNASYLHIDLNEVDFVVLSHHHWDHAGGLRFHPFKTKKKIVLHPDTLTKLPADQADYIKENFEVISSASPVEIAKDIYFLGHIPRKTVFEKGTYESDPMSDDSGIAVRTETGTVVITGCSHAGVCNICEAGKAATGQPLRAVIGGFHLLDDNPAILGPTVDYLKQQPGLDLFPMHCVGVPALAALYNNFRIQKFSAGEIFELP